MVTYIGRRLLFIAVVYVLIVYFVHMGMGMLRNSDTAQPSFDLVSQGRNAWRATRTSLGDLLRGNLGTVRADTLRVPVGEYVRRSYVNSLGLLLVALACATLVGLGVGTFAALSRSQVLATPLMALTVLGISTPSFFAGLLLQVGEIAYLRTFGRRLVSIAGFGWDVEHMLMPVLVLAARPVAYLSRATYISMQHVLTEDYIRTAFSKGLSLERTVIQHAIRNVAVPVLTAVGVSVRFSLSSLPVVEFLFAWPGLGRNLLLAINGRQTSLVIVLASALGLTFLLTNLVLDLLYRVIDPRTRDA